MPMDFNIPLEGGHMLRCTRFPARDEAAGLIIIAHGYKGFKDWGMFPYIAEQLSKHHEVVTFNFSHNGIGHNPLEFTELERFAVNTYERELNDLKSLISHLRREEKLRSLPLFLLGHSRGAGVCLVYALDHQEDVTGILSWNGVTSLDLFTEAQKQEMRENGRSYVMNGRTGQQMPLDVAILEDLERQQERYNILKRIPSATFKIALIQGSNDGAHLREGSSSLVSIRPDIPWIHIPGGNHTFNTVHPFQGTTAPLEEALKASLLFINQTLSLIK
ncbi:alpha/beta fold hydrolase [Paenibacillus bouchesdurhonensis]|uniref:alpha/beta fold hydrolase n=1 Tax=Paenibacillus bouchesdurhonensis TaxID=1870990 RepID=UPI000DA631B3|nr:alpha/beta fold hydrolase [Paenibacillus bouchesdurhonensis]